MSGWERAAAAGRFRRGAGYRILPAPLRGGKAMPIKPLTWILAGLFLLFGLPLLATDGEAGRRFWAGLSTLSLGGFALSMAHDALLSGQLRLQNSTIYYARQPRVFWAMVALIVAAGLATLGTALWLLFFKA